MCAPLPHHTSECVSSSQQGGSIPHVCVLTVGRRASSDLKGGVRQSMSRANALRPCRTPVNQAAVNDAANWCVLHVCAPSSCVSYCVCLSAGVQPAAAMFSLPLCVPKIYPKMRVGLVLGWWHMPSLTMRKCVVSRWIVNFCQLLKVESSASGAESIHV